MDCPPFGHTEAPARIPTTDQEGYGDLQEHQFAPSAPMATSVQGSVHLRAAMETSVVPTVRPVDGRIVTDESATIVPHNRAVLETTQESSQATATSPALAEPLDSRNACADVVAEHLTSVEPVMGGDMVSTFPAQVPHAKSRRKYLPPPRERIPREASSRSKQLRVPDDKQKDIAKKPKAPKPKAALPPKPTPKPKPKPLPKKGPAKLPSPLEMYCRGNWKRLEEEKPHFSPKELQRRLQNEWCSMSEVERKPWKGKSSRAMARLNKVREEKGLPRVGKPPANKDPTSKFRTPKPRSATPKPRKGIVPQAHHDNGQHMYAQESDPYAYPSGDAHHHYDGVYPGDEGTNVSDMGEVIVDYDVGADYVDDGHESSMMDSEMQGSMMEDEGDDGEEGGNDMEGADIEGGEEWEEGDIEEAVNMEGGEGSNDLHGQYAAHHYAADHASFQNEED
mmetsp:Transcript_76740/g.135511  ORF Transcript_76740/g.135511 Transcript_76740/m.135511 type:complete len:450 (-) Transcript_76740:174-1523(-)